MSEDEIVIDTPPFDPRIEIPGPSDLIREYYRQLQSSRELVHRLMTPQILAALPRVMTMSGYADGWDRLSPGEADVHHQLQILAEQQVLQFNLARNIIGELLPVYAGREKIPLSTLSCAYWAGGMDQFVWDMAGQWKHIGLEEPHEIDIRMAGRPVMIQHNIAEPALPLDTPPESLDISLFKTLGSAPSLFYDAFWRKIDQTTKPGGLVISTYDLPTQYRKGYRPYVQLTELIGTSSLQLNAPMAYWQLHGGYYAREFNIFQKQSISGV